jgi:hypothetical protein
MRRKNRIVLNETEKQQVMSAFLEAHYWDVERVLKITDVEGSTPAFLFMSEKMEKLRERSPHDPRYPVLELAAIDLLRSDIPLDRRHRNMVAQLLYFHVFPNGERDRLMRRKRQQKQFEELRNDLRRRKVPEPAELAAAWLGTTKGAITRARSRLRDGPRKR